MPLQMHSSPSRFCDGKSRFAVMYAALSFETCIVETLVRDRFTHRLKHSSKLTGDDCIAVFDRAVGKLRVVDALELTDHAELPTVLERNKVQLVDD
jgi:hypothetical protein